MVRVEVRDFQSIAAEAVEISGFSVVVGRSNIGKSALVRAVKAALTGAPADNYVRHSVDCPRVLKGAKACKCFCSVRITSTEFDLLWEKGDAVNRYVFNGTEHTVVGKGTPEFLGSAFSPLYIGGDSTPTLLQVADQFRPLFILDRSGTAVADVLSDVAKLDQINDAVRAAEKDKRECSATRKVRDKDVKELERALAKYEGLDAVLARARDLAEMDAALVNLETRAETLDRFVNATAQLTKGLQALLPAAKLEIPPVAPLVEQAQQLRALSRWLELLRSKIEATRHLEIVATLEVPDIASATHMEHESRRLVKWANQLGSMRAAFASLKAIESAVVPEVSGLATLHSKLRVVSAWAEKASGLAAGIAQLHKAVATADSDEAAVLADFKALEVCPTCRQPVAIDHIHLGAA